MGWFDFLRNPDDQRDRVAIALDLEAGVLASCPVCRTVYDRQHVERLAAADRLAHRRFDRQDPEVAVFAGDREDLLRRLRSVRRRYGYNCLCQEMG